MSFNWTSIVFTIIAFLILYWLLTRYAFGPLFSVMEKRRQLVLQQMNEAAQTREQAAAYVEEQKQALQQARKEAYDIIEQSKQTGNKQAEQIIVQAKDEAVRLKDEAVREITSERNKAVAELRSEVGKASVQIASKLIQKEIKEDQVQGELVDQYLKEVGGKA
ncbi:MULTISPECIES: F0F1 ATP synthase subunit B [Paenibacillus]|uniref:F0F1 ATP synthase subunit B n=1 Tax=Paenibacillus TaxID=44249 RepID=UPI000845DA0C|nr:MULTISPECIES: F0F1 ATP synthase subunit B [Paenibacillus]AOK90186.1 ATP synthase F0 subunit B [Paenibacillus polymyxa]MCP3778024.1 F0F1 ATP synthase subunit B [Paenibacillus sp. MZ03-122A]MCP3807963.1 F0F1 ATP synthase subunit B [Paenibacillus sp. Lou8.1]URJ39205.1 F0F1 ATP synthase subunit B [Paenibacillus polymyxa]URJ43427.1 F0F1 ATP synthase subunit B [Paenibacillus polymyxa]